MRTILFAAAVCAAVTASASFRMAEGAADVAAADEGPDAAFCVTTAVASAVRVVVAPSPAGGEPELVDHIAGVDDPDSPFAGSLEDLAAAEKRVELVGFLWPDSAHVLVPDFGVATNALAPIIVRAGGAAATGRVVRIYRDRPYLQLALDRPLPAAALNFSGGAPVAAVRVGQRADRADGSFVAVAGGLETGAFDDAGRPVAGVDVRGAVLFDADGNACGLLGAADARPLDDLVPDPARWAAWTPEDWAAAGRRVEAAARASVLPVTLRFRAPPLRKFGVDDDGESSWRMSFDDDRGSDDVRGGLELRTTGVLVSPTRLAVDLNPAVYKRLARLEAVEVHFAGRTAQAKFVAALASASLMLADLAEPMPGAALASSERAPGTTVGEALFDVLVEPEGPASVRVRLGRVRPRTFSPDWRGFATWKDAGAALRDSYKGGVFCFDAAGHWLWRELEVRTKDTQIGDRENWRSGDRRSAFLRAADFVALVTSPAAGDLDLAAKPAAAHAESPAGTLGIDVQAMDRDLAELLNAGKDTEGGKFGALVTAVDMGSTAAKAGVADGWILLSLRPAGGLVQRVALDSDNSAENSERSRYWDSEGGEDATGEYYGWSIPWHTRNTALTAALTKLGVGRKVEAEFLAGGARVRKNLVVELAAPDYKNAPAWKWTEGGISVCDLTDDVRETLALEDDAPGVVVCGRESGSHAVVAGIRPYEIITSVDGKPVKSIQDFEKAVTGRKSARFDVLRLTTSRTVNVEY